jgi:hypothetical protein
MFRELQSASGCPAMMREKDGTLCIELSAMGKREVRKECSGRVLIPP